MIEQFLNTELDPIQTIESYSKIAPRLMFLEECVVRKVVEKLKKNVEDWAVNKSLVYKNHDIVKTYNRKDLLNKDDWYVEELKEKSQNFSTSGSTTGDPFSYSIWSKYIDYIEDKHQYGMILDEFDINRKNINILVLMKLPYNPKIEEFGVEQISDSGYTMHTHKSISSKRYFVNFNDYIENPEVWHKKLFEFIGNKSFDVIISTGPSINTLCFYLKKFNYTNKLCKLLSHTGEFLIKQDAYYLKENKYIDNFCDHMRCWDGGATFFTCKFGTYHLMDNLSWVEEGESNKMISTDYFSLPAPFIRYWNGDLCEISDDYKRCDCGRLYRSFKMLENRPFGLKGTTKLTFIKQQVSRLDFKQDIVQVKFDNLKVDIIAKRELSDVEKEQLNNIFNEYKINYSNYG